MKTKKMKRKVDYLPPVVELKRVVTENVITGSVNQIIIEGPEWNDGGEVIGDDIIFL